MSVTQLPAATVKLITSSQIITSVSSAVKELFENALDAGATSVDVKLVNYGLDRIEVRDNGSGISKENTTCMALPHCTSKISDFKDLESLETYGFRGEALNALCRVGQVTITTATSSDPMAVVYTLDASGNISGTKPAPHVPGTTVVVLNLFKNLPVRRQLMGSNKKSQEELKLVEAVVKSLAVIKTNIRVTLSHNKCLIWQKTPCSSLQNSFSQLIGYPTSQQLEQISLKINNEACVDILVPKRDCDITTVTKSTPVFSLVFVNNRPITHKKLLKVLHQQLSEKFADNFSSRKFAVCLFSILLSPSNIDVNLEPNKTKVLLQNEDAILSDIETQLQSYYNVPNFAKEISTLQNEMSAAAKHGRHSPLAYVDEDCVRKRRRVDEDNISTECEKVHDTILQNAEENMLSVQHYRSSDKEHSSSDIPMQSAQIIENGWLANNPKTIQGEKQLSKGCFAKTEDHPISVTYKAPSLTPGNAFCEEDGHDVCQEVQGSSHTDQENQTEAHVDFLVSASNDNVKSNLDCPKRTIEEASSGGELEHLWDQVDAKDLDELSFCLDALESVPASSTQGQKDNKSVNNPPKVDHLVGTEAWSMGHVDDQQGGLVKGSCVLLDGNTAAADRHVKQAPCFLQPDNATPAKVVHETVNRSPEKSPKLFPAQKSPRATDSIKSSPILDSSLQSVSSQMGRRELAAFTKFAREIRPQIILENPGIPFTHVASMLAEKWQAISSQEREHYEEIARETATSKKIWKTHDNQRKLEWVKKLPSKDEKKATAQLKGKRPPRKEVLSSVSMDNIRAKVFKSLLGNSRENQSSKTKMNLIGRLEPSGSWLFEADSEIVLLNHSRLQEVVINHRLLNTHALSLKPLTTREQLNSMVLGEEAWKTLLSLSCTFDHMRQTKIVSADIIVKNGFKIEIQEGNLSAVLTEVAESLNYYGVKELKETLAYASTMPHAELSQCRPLRVVSHIKSEAMRICRKSPSMLERTMIEELLEYWKTVMQPEDVTCLHSKPILCPVYNLKSKTNLLA